MSRKSKEIPFQECNLFQEVASCPCNITLPLAGMCGGGFSGSPGGVTATLLSVFCFVSFLWALGEELEVLLELVTVSPELHETVGFTYRCNWCFLQPDIYIWEARTRNFGYYNSWQLINCKLLKKKCCNCFCVCFNCTCFLDTWPEGSWLWRGKKMYLFVIDWSYNLEFTGNQMRVLPLCLCRLWKYWQVRIRVNRKMDNRPSEQISTAHRYTSAKQAYRTVRT